MSIEIVQNDIDNIIENIINQKKIEYKKIVGVFDAEFLNQFTKQLYEVNNSITSNTDINLSIYADNIIIKQLCKMHTNDINIEIYLIDKFLPMAISIITRMGYSHFSKLYIEELITDTMEDYDGTCLFSIAILKKFKDKIKEKVKKI